MDEEIEKIIRWKMVIRFVIQLNCFALTLQSGKPLRHLLIGHHRHKIKKGSE